MVNEKDVVPAIWHHRAAVPGPPGLGCDTPPAEATVPQIIPVQPSLKDVEADLDAQIPGWRDMRLTRWQRGKTAGKNDPSLSGELPPNPLKGLVGAQGFEPWTR